MKTQPKYRTMTFEYDKLGKVRRQTAYLGWGYLNATNAAIEWARIADQGTRIIIEEHDGESWHGISERFASPSEA